LQMLLQQYVQFGLELKIDWTAIVGPLLKAILDALVSFLQQITAMILAPLDCVITSLEATNDLLKESLKTADIAVASGQAFADTFKKDEEGKFVGIPGLAGQKSFKASDYVNVTSEGEDERGSGTLFTKADNSIFNFDVREHHKSTGVNVPIGFELRASDTLASRMNDSSFRYASPLQQMIMAVREARNYVANLFNNILYSFKSLNAFMSGSVGLQLTNSGSILLILDLIAFTKMLIKLMGHGKPSDWCEMLKSNPNLLSLYFEEFDWESKALDMDGIIDVSMGPWSGSVHLDSGCAGNRSSETSNILSQWTSDLEKAMK